MSLLMLKAFIPGFFADVTAIICKPGQLGTPRVVDISPRIRRLRADLFAWHSRYGRFMVELGRELPAGSAEQDSHSKVEATYLCCMIITTRLLSSIAPSDRVDLEFSASEHADRMFRLEEEVRDVNVQTTLFLAQTLGVSASIKMTMEDWIGDLSLDKRGLEDSEGVIARWKFEAWNNVCGRKLPSPH